MKVNRPAGWLLLTLTPLLMSVRSQQPTAVDSSEEQVATPAAPASMIAHQRWLADPVKVLLQQVGEINLKCGPRAGGGLYGNSNIGLPMSQVVKE
ncbi:hypothetical protein [Paraflavitalea pollutisoli]|uniref:hypothetical protein n=1 Tax=Paraflavitalea pollutisoli TaxID=3034143 RepID=UPI0023EAB161|nr:hypothetical protein [Paraflavitalea sp. H1-2-19X]